MLEEVVRLLCDRAHALNLSAGKTYAKLGQVEQGKDEALRKMVQARDQLDKAELRNTSLQRQRLEMGKQLGWLETEGGGGRGGAGGGGLILSAAEQEEVNALRMRCLELEGKLEHRDMVGDKLEGLMDRLKDMATAGVSAVAAARAARNTLANRRNGGRKNNNNNNVGDNDTGDEENKQGDATDDDDDDLATNVYDELGRFQESLAGLETPVASGSLEFAVLVTGFVVQTLSHELLARDPNDALLIAGGAGNNDSGMESDSIARQKQKLGEAMALFEQEKDPNSDAKITQLKNQVSVLGDQLKQQTQAAAAAKVSVH